MEAGGLGPPPLSQCLAPLRRSGGMTVSSVLETTDPQVISSTLLRTKTRDILEQAKFRGEHFIVETFGKPMVAIVGVEEYWDLLDQVRAAEHPQGSEEPL